MEEVMFKCDITKLKLSFNEFHDAVAKDMPEYGSYCLLELKDGRYTAGQWHPKNYKDKKKLEGCFGRGTADTVDVNEVAKWHALSCYDLSECLECEDITVINMGEKKEGSYSVRFDGFKILKGRSYPKEEQFCLLIMKDGTLAAGRWNKWRGHKGGWFIYASALSSHSSDSVWAWTPLSTDDVFAAEEEREKEKALEKKLNKNPVADPNLFKYGTDIEVYYEKALEKLKKEYPWASLAQMKKKQPYVIAPRHGKYIFGLDNGVFYDTREIREWTGGSTADEFIDFLYEYTKDAVRDSDPDERFKFGKDISVYLDMAFNNVKKDYTWLDKKMLKKTWQYDIQQVNGDTEFVTRYYDDFNYRVVDCRSAEEFIKYVEHDYQEAALRANPVVASYDVPFGHIEIHGWNLEQYRFYKLASGDYKVMVQAGDRVTGGSRDFFITPHCFEAKTYGEFLDRYLEIVPGYSFGLGKADLIDDAKLKKFLGYA